MIESELDPKEIALRAHDIVVCLEDQSVPEFDLLSLLGMAVRLSLHFRGVQAISYNVVRNAAIYLLSIPPSAVRPVLELLAEAEFVRLDTVGRSIRTVIPDVPYYENIFTNLALVSNPESFNEAENLALLLAHKLSESPIPKEYAYQTGADKKLVDRIISIGTQGSFIIDHRTRGKSIILSPTYFPESGSSYAELVASQGASRVARVLKILKENQGWPLKLIERDKEISGSHLSKEDLAVVRSLAGEGFIPPPAIETRHAGITYFLFGPRPSGTRLPSYKRPVYEAAMALVAAVRQGQLLPRQYAIKWPEVLLKSLKEKRYIRANTEAVQQYRQVAALKVGRLEFEKGSQEWARFVLIDRPENIEAVDLAIEMVRGDEPQVAVKEDIVIALRGGERYVDSLVGRKMMIKESKPPAMDDESKAAIDAFLLRGAS